MSEVKFDPGIADAILTGRMLRIPTLRGMAERVMRKLEDHEWEVIEPKWRMHDRLPLEELQAPRPGIKRRFGV